MGQDNESAAMQALRISQALNGAPEASPQPNAATRDALRERLEAIQKTREANFPAPARDAVKRQPGKGSEHGEVETERRLREAQDRSARGRDGRGLGR